MGLITKIIQSKAFERTKRKLELTSGFHFSLKKLSASSSPDLRTVKILQHHNFDVVIDVGANTGQFAESLLDFGFKGQIVSFEPTSDAYKELSKRAQKYPNWDIEEQMAIGNDSGTITINISKNTVFNSIKKIDTEYATYNNDAQIIGSEEVPIKTLNSFKEKYFNGSKKVLLKIDTQGFEKEVLEGASEIIEQVDGIKIEVPLQPIYDDVKLTFKEMINTFYDLGFTCVSLDEVAVNKTSGYVHEMDAIFVRA